MLPRWFGTMDLAQTRGAESDYEGGWISAAGASYA